MCVPIRVTSKVNNPTAQRELDIKRCGKTEFPKCSGFPREPLRSSCPAFTQGYFTTTAILSLLSFTGVLLPVDTATCGNRLENVPPHPPPPNYQHLTQAQTSSAP